MSNQKDYTKTGIKERIMFDDIFKTKAEANYICTPPEGFDTYDFKMASGTTNFWGEIKVRKYDVNVFNEWIIEASKIVELQQKGNNKCIMNIHSSGYRIWDVTDLRINYIGHKVTPKELSKYNHGDLVKMQLQVSDVEEKGDKWKDVIVLKNIESLEKGTHHFNNNLINKRVDEIYQIRYEHCSR